MTFLRPCDDPNLVACSCWTKETLLLLKSEKENMKTLKTLSSHMKGLSAGSCHECLRVLGPSKNVPSHITVARHLKSRSEYASKPLDRFFFGKILRRMQGSIALWWAILVTQHRSDYRKSWYFHPSHLWRPVFAFEVCCLSVPKPITGIAKRFSMSLIFLSDSFTRSSEKEQQILEFETRQIYHR